VSLGLTDRALTDYLHRMAVWYIYTLNYTTILPPGLYLSNTIFIMHPPGHTCPSREPYCYIESTGLK